MKFRLPSARGRRKLAEEALEHWIRGIWGERLDDVEELFIPAVLQVAERGFLDESSAKLSPLDAPLDHMFGQI